MTEWTNERTYEQVNETIEPSDAVAHVNVFIWMGVENLWTHIFRPTTMNRK